MICKTCETDRPLSDFPKCKRGKFGVRPHCRDCLNAQAREAYSNDPEKFKLKRRVQYNPENRRNTVLKKKFGLTLAEYKVLLEKQNGVCAICKQPEKNRSRYQEVALLSVDHNHTSGKIRGLLCGNCNRGLGLFRDDPTFLSAAIIYLKGFHEHSS